MISKSLLRFAPAAAMAALLLTAAQPAYADFAFDLPAGLACDFALGIVATGDTLHSKEFFDKDGNLVRILSAGKGALLTYTNLDATGQSITIRTDGSVASTRVNADGTLTVTATGHNGLIMFPSDVPAGPTTTHYTGKIVYNIDPATGIFTLVSTTGKALDVCAAIE